MIEAMKDFNEWCQGNPLVFDNTDTTEEGLWSSPRRKNVLNKWAAALWQAALASQAERDKEAIDKL